MSKTKGREKAMDSAAGSEPTVVIEKLQNNERRVQSKVRTKASLDQVWTVLTNYGKLSDINPDLTASEVLERQGNRSRVSQVGQKSMPMGVKMKIKLVVDYFEKEPERLASGKKREIEFKLVEGDFQVYHGNWCVEQFEPAGPDAESTLVTYSITAKPKSWVPVGMMESRLTSDVKRNLNCVREASLRVMNEAN